VPSRERNKKLKRVESNLVLSSLKIVETRDGLKLPRGVKPKE
jgi:hypothetical protein